MINLTDLDPDVHKKSLISYFKTKKQFKDWDFEDSNINLLLDVLVHNSYLGNFYKNMIYAESQLDSCVLRDSALSKAKELNYLPQSRKSSEAVVDITINASNIDSLEIPKGTQFSGRNGISTYVFTTNQAITAKSSTGNFEFKNVYLFEGNYVSDVYVMNIDEEDQKILINDRNVDINSLSVYILAEGQLLPEKYERVTTLYDLTSLSKVYFVEGFSQDRYRIRFGNGIFGYQPPNGSKVVLEYRSVDGKENADNIREFNLDEDVANMNGGILDTISITTVQSSLGGTEREDIESIKFNAPRHYSAQERAVADSDFKSILTSRFGGDIGSMIVYGGEKATPKQYGKTIIAIKPKNGDIIPDYLKNNILSYIRKFTITRPVIVNSDLIYLKVDTTVQFNSALTSFLINDIKSKVEAKIKNYSLNKLEVFGADFRLSKFTTEIDNSDESVVSNQTEIQIIKRLYPKTSVSEIFVFSLENPLKNDPGNSILSSNSFTYLNSDTGVQYSNCYFDDMYGKIRIVQYDLDQKNIVNRNVGTIDYETGEIKINQVVILDLNKCINLYIKPRNSDIIASTNKIIAINVNDVNVDVIEALE